MRINHNISALNASNCLKANDSAITQNIKKLSSGYRINSAADDAAGLAVSEKMRAQINGLTQAEDNVENGTSLVQTAEGGLNETESILQRMNTLAVESANGTYDDTTDRANLDLEIEALKSEVDRISTSTNFNGISLLDGSLSTPTVEVSDAVGGGALTSTTATAGVYTLKSKLTDATGDTAATNDVLTISYTDEDGNSQSVTATLTYDTTNKVYSYEGSTATYATSADAMSKALAADKSFSDAFNIDINGSGTLEFTAKTAGTTGAVINEATEHANDADVSTQASEISTAAADATSTLDAASMKVYGSTNSTTGTSSTTDAIFTVNGVKFAYAESTDKATDFGADVNVVVVDSTTSNDAANSTDAASMASLIEQKTGLTSSNNGTEISFTSEGEAVTFQIGSDNAEDQRVSLSISDMSSKGLGIENLSVGTQEDAEAAIDTITSAINTVSSSRAKLGALQNRLEHTSNNLSTMNENLTSAESTIRDVDMSSEMVDLTKNQILEQAATSMLSQANAQPQSVLSLLQG